MRTLLLLLATTLPAQVFAVSISYICTINGEYIFNSNGELVSDKKYYSGQIFIAKRNYDPESGLVIANQYFPMDSPIADMVEVEQSYNISWASKKVIGNPVNLNIGDFNQSSPKPFSMVVRSRVVSGVCK